MIKLPVNDMVNLGINDIHPLLYYFIFRFFTKFFLLFNYDNPIIIGIIVSLIPQYLLCLFNYSVIKNTFDWKTAGWFNLLIFSMPNLMLFSTEIRMYSWALLFITVAFVYLIKIISNSSLKNWTIFTLMVICASYTHYFAGITSVSLYLVLFFYIIFKKRELIKSYFLSFLVSVLAYLPWLPYFYIQIKTVHSGYWIKEMTFKQILYLILYSFVPSFKLINFDYCNFDVLLNHKIKLIIGLILLFIVISTLIYLYHIKKLNKIDFIAIASFSLVYIIGILISIIHTPIFADRYIIPSLGILWLLFALCLSKLGNNKIIVFILIFIMMIGCISSINYTQFQMNEHQKTIDKINIIDNSEITDKDIIIVIDEAKSEHANVENVFYFQNNEFHSIKSDNIKDILLQINTIVHNSQNKLNNGSNIYIIDKDNSYNDALLSNNFNTSYTGMGPFGIEPRQYVIYKLNL